MSIAFTPNRAAAAVTAPATAAATQSHTATTLARGGEGRLVRFGFHHGEPDGSASDSQGPTLPLLPSMAFVRMPRSCASASSSETNPRRRSLARVGARFAQPVLRLRTPFPGWTPRPGMMAPLEALSSSGGPCAGPIDPLTHACAWGVAACLAGPISEPAVAPLLVDTGAMATVLPQGILTDDVRRESQIGTAFVTGAAGVTKPTPMYVVPLRVGDGQVTTPVIESEVPGDVGVLGVAGPLTRDSIVELDPAAGRFCLHDADDETRAALNLEALPEVPSSACRFDDTGLIYVSVTVGGGDVGECLLDTGCNTAMTLPHSERESVAKALGQAWGWCVAESQTVHGTAGQSTGEFWRGEVAVGGIPLGTQTILVAGEQPCHENAATRLLGMPSLHDKRVVIDYPRKKLFIGSQPATAVQ